MSSDVKTEVFIPLEASIRTVHFHLLPQSITKHIKLRPLDSKQPVTLISPIELRETASAARAPPLSPGRKFLPVGTSNRPAFQLLQTFLQSGQSSVEFVEVRTRTDPVLRKRKSSIILYDGEIFLSIRKNGAGDWSEEQRTSTIHECDAPPSISPVTQEEGTDDIIERRHGDGAGATKDHGNFMEDEEMNDVIEKGGDEDTDIEEDDGGDAADKDRDNPQKSVTDSGTNTRSSISIKIKAEVDNPAVWNEISNDANIEEMNSLMPDVVKTIRSVDGSDVPTACNITEKPSSGHAAQTQSARPQRSPVSTHANDCRSHIEPLIKCNESERTPKVWNRNNVREGVSDAAEKINTDEVIAGNGVKGQLSEVQRSSSDSEFCKIKKNHFVPCRRRLNFHNGGEEPSCHGDDVITVDDERPTSNYNNDTFHNVSGKTDVIQIDDDDDDDDVKANGDVQVLAFDDNVRRKIKFSVTELNTGDTRVVDIKTKRNTQREVGEAERSEEVKRGGVRNDAEMRDERDGKSVSTNVQSSCSLSKGGKRKHSDCHADECFMISDGEHAKVSKSDHLIHAFDQENGYDGGMSLEAANQSGAGPAEGLSPAPSTSTASLTSIDHLMRIRGEKIARLEEKLKKLKNDM